MSAAQALVRGPLGSLTQPSIIGTLARYGTLVVVDAFALLLVYALARDQVWVLVVTIAIVTVAVNIINLRPELYPLRWMSPAIALIGLLVLFPLFYTVYVGFTNFSDGHLLTKVQTIDLLGNRRFLPEGGASYNWTAFKAEDGRYALWLRDADGNAFVATIGEPLQAVTPGESGSGPFDDDGIPSAFEEYQRLERRDLVQALSDLEGLEFGVGDDVVGIKNRNEAGPFRQKYVYDEGLDAILDVETNTVYFANYEVGEFLSESGEELDVGFWVPVGFDNFQRFLSSPALSGPLVNIFLWTITFAAISVLSTFALGLLFALLLDAGIPGGKIIRTLLIVPYAIPGLISVAIWKGMLNPNLGVISTNLANIFGSAPPWFSDGTWAKIGILLINLWLGFPYFMLVCSGALQAIPSDIYEAAEVDGANPYQRFLRLTFPLLLISVGPLLIASFTFNFNNFVIIEAFNEGNPPFANTPTPAGQTDLLISYAFRLAFGTGRGQDFGMASAVTIIIFLMVAAVTLFQFRFTRGWEEVSENV